MRPIDADALIDDLMERYCKECDKRKGMKKGKRRFIYEIGEAPCRACEVDDVKAELEEAPSIEPKKGRWKDAWMDRQCSLCGIFVAREIAREANFCPNCGAKMEGSEDATD